MVDMLGRAGDLEAALEVIKRMPEGLRLVRLLGVLSVECLQKPWKLGPRAMGCFSSDGAGTRELCRVFAEFKHAHEEEAVG